jgi:lipid-A-disaccharide synthase
MKCFIFAGEKSGDMHGANLLVALKNKLPNLELTGVFGDKIKALGYKPLIDMKEFQVMGFSEVIKALPRLRRHFKTLLSFIIESKPDLVILVDYPGFNLRLASKLRKKGFLGKIVHYVCPSVWAWKKGRIEAMAKTLDLLLCIFPFEPKYFSHTDLEAIYIGNPTLEAIEKHSFQSDWKRRLGIPEKRPLLALFPGSRIDEIKRNLPIQLKAAELLKKDFPELVICVSGVASKYYEIPYEYTYELMKDTALSFAKCGTTILELALLQTPTVVTYQVSHVNFFIAKYLFNLHKLPFYSLPNILLKKEVFPELIYYHFTAKNTYEKGKELLSSPKNESCLRDCLFVKEALKTNRSCSDVGADLICQLFPTFSNL